jgi:hypothetical protein
MPDVVNLPLTGVGDATAKVAVDDSDVAFGEVQLIGYAVQSPHDQLLLSSNLSAGANVDLTAADITTGRVGRLLGADLGCSVPCRYDIQIVNGPRTTRSTIYTGPGETFPWRVPMGGRWIELTGGATKAFGLSITNLDVNQAADVRGTLYWDEVAP